MRQSRKGKPWPRHSPVTGSLSSWKPGISSLEISSFGLHLAAEGKAARTIRTYVEAVAWFAAAHLLGEAGRTGWEQVGKRDVQQWMVWLLDRYSAAYMSPG